MSVNKPMYLFTYRMSVYVPHMIVFIQDVCFYIEDVCLEAHIHCNCLHTRCLFYTHITVYIQDAITKYNTSLLEEAVADLTQAWHTHRLPLDPALEAPFM